MISEQTIELVVNDQKGFLLNKDSGTLRNIDYDRLLKSNQIVVVTGIRRSGKSTLLHQIAKLHKEFHYINFDDERLFDFELADFQKLMIIFKKKSNSKIIFIDEIQNVPNWERFVRRIFDEDHKIYITGSNSKLLSSELATHLTGRYIKIELFPFSFKEFLNYKNIEIYPLTSDSKANILKTFDEYLFTGGFPGFHLNKDIFYIQQIFDDIIYKDLITRFEIRNMKTFKQLAHYLLTNFTKEISYNSLKNALNLSNVNTIKDYIDYLQQAYLVFECYKFDFSLKKQIVYNKKIYCIDNGLQKSISFNFSTNHGHLLENLIYTELRRKFPQVFYFKTKQNYEVDFVVQEKEIALFQVCYSLDNAKSFEREKRALNEAMKELNVQSGTILTYNHQDSITSEFGQIDIIPAWKWLIGNDL
jgi:uncharacterized protein